MDSERVWCVLVMNDERYAVGAAAVAQSLKNVGSKYPAWCAVTDTVGEECLDLLRSSFDKIVKVPLITHECVAMKSRKQNQIYSSWIHMSFTKWNILSRDMFPVDKIILIDADMLFLKNADELFELEPPALTFSSPWVKPFVPKGGYNPYYSLNHGDVVPEHFIRKSFTTSGILGLACMVLARPNNTLYDRLFEILNRELIYGSTKCISGVDEQLIAEVFLSDGKPIHHIHQRYNWIVGKKIWLPNEEPYTQQYYNGKPWLEDPSTTEWEDVKQWYDVWAQVCGENPAWTAWWEKVSKK